MKVRYAAILAGFALVFLPKTVFAGEINGNEQRILGIVQGGFEYEGITYVAAPGYVEKVRSYLAQDDVDLTAEQASEAASEIYSNIATGVSEGYIIPSQGAEETKSQDALNGAQTPEPEQNPEAEKNSGSKNDMENEAESEAKAQNTSEKKIIISTKSGMVEAVNEKGESLFVSDSIIKDTGFDFSGLLLAAFVLILGIGISMLAIVKYQLLANHDES